MRDAENARTLNEFALTARRVLELGTIEGARSLGIDDKVGSLRPGKRADIIMVNTRALNMGGFVDPAHLLVGSALPENVDTVIIDGRILKQSGKLTALSTAESRSAPRATALTSSSIRGNVQLGGPLWRLSTTTSAWGIRESRLSSSATRSLRRLRECH